MFINGQQPDVLHGGGSCSNTVHVGPLLSGGTQSNPASPLRVKVRTSHDSYCDSQCPWEPGDGGDEGGGDNEDGGVMVMVVVLRL